MKRNTSAKELKKQCAVSMLEQERKKAAPSAKITIGDMIESYNRNRETRFHKEYREIINQTPGWLKVMREFGVRTVVAKRLGPDGENFYEPVFN